MRAVTWQMAIVLALASADGLAAVARLEKAPPATPAAEPLKAKDVVELTLHPARPPRPALKYRLLPAFIDQFDENAALLYIKAMLMMAESKTLGADTQKMSDWSALPPDKLPQKDGDELVERYGSALREVEIAARRSRCDWSLPVREVRDVFGIVLPEVQATRNIGRLLALKARLEIRAGNCDDAVATLATGYVLARHVAQGPFLVNGLVAITIASMMNAQMETLIQQPGMANLYWSLTALPQPLIDLGPAFAEEESSIYLVFPDIRELLKSKNAPPQQWLATLTAFARRFRELVSLTADDNSPDTAFWRSLALEAGFLATTPVSRHALIVRGRPETEVNAMSPAEVVLRDLFETYDDFRDDIFKAVNLPYWQAAPVAEKGEKALHVALTNAGLIGKPRLALPGLLLPALHAALLAQARGQRYLDALRCIEALRLYAAEHGGKLPASLDDIHEVPIPLNPVTGKGFNYRLEGDTAVLLADGGGPQGRPREYRIKTAK